MVLLAVLAVSAAVQLKTILPYTRIWHPQSVVVPAGIAQSRPGLKVLLSNVLQFNSDYRGLIDLIDREAPDVCVFMETDEAWQNALERAGEDYPDKIEQIQDNTYGIMVWSKLKVEDAEVRFLVNEDIPSVRADIRLDDGTRFRLIAVHPEPPMPADHTVERDAEIVLVGLEAADLEMPVIVTGDLNDVAWSRTTSRFLRVSKLLDPRIGHGLQNTFHAHYWFMRWPLDHVFHSDDFSLVRLERLPAYGSDHFPLLCELVLDPAVRSSNPPPEPRREDVAEASDLLENVSDDTARKIAEAQLKY